MRAADDTVREPLVEPHVDDADNGDVVLGRLDDFLDLMTRLGPLYLAWCAHPAARGGWRGQPGCGQGPQERLLDLLRPLHWGRLHAAYQRLDNLHTAAVAAGSTASLTGARLADAWQGAAGEHAGARFGELGAASQHYATELEALGAALRGVLEASRDAVRALACFADDISDARRPTGQRFDPFRNAADATPAAIERYRAHIGLLDRVLADGGYPGDAAGTRVLTDLPGAVPFPRAPVSPQTLRTPLAVLLHAGGELLWATRIVNELDDFAQRYHDTMAEFRDRVERTARQVDELLRTFAEQLTGQPAGDR